MNKAEFDKAMNALLLHIDKSTVDSIRKIGHEYAENAYPNTEADGIVFCGKCGTII